MTEMTSLSEASQEKYFYNSKKQILRVLKPDEELGFEYDKNGNTIRQESGNGTDVYEYDSLNRMVKAVTAKGDSLACRYDAFGLRIEMEENEKLYGFIFDEEKVVVELDDSDKPTERYIRGKGLVAKYMDGSRYYYHSDALSSTMFITDSDGERKNSYSYDAFGVMVDREESIKNRMTYAGEQYDSITGQYYLRARYYNPDIGRFTQEDIYRGDGLNLYAYCGNNPVAYVDPSGYAKKKPKSGNCSVNKENAFADTAEGVSNPETYYRTMSQADYDYLRMTGELPSTGETFISPTKAFSDNYKGATVEFKLNPGTTSQLENIGLRNNAMLTKKVYPNMNSVSGVKGWNENFTLFKAEGNQINIGLGKGKGLEIFNSNIDSFMRVGGK